MILEGCYPYVTGGVSSWANGYIQAMPQHEFVLWTIGAKMADKGKFKYKLPANVTAVHEVFLDEALTLHAVARRRSRFTEKQVAALTELLKCGHPDWPTIFELYNTGKMHPVEFLMSREFLAMLEDICREDYPFVPFSDLFHMMRSMLLPVLFLLGQEVPEADCYHAICTGYGGLLGALGGWKTGKPFLVTEHGIYTREREEELIRARWVSPIFKPYWTRFFYMLSELAYGDAAKVTSLFENARRTQVSMGCPAGKTQAIANGIRYENFCNIPPRSDADCAESINIGAVVRIAPIKDIKTMLYAFQELKVAVPAAHLYVMGGIDDEEYNAECHALVRRLKIKDVHFTGVIQVLEYLPRMDFTILTSISEGQPLSVLESFAAGRPCVTTDVGCCRSLLEGDTGDELGSAGACVPPMNKSALAREMENLCRKTPAQRAEMGRIGRERVNRYYRHEAMVKNYLAMYREVVPGWQESALN